MTSCNYFFDHSFCNYYQSFPSQVRSGTPHWTRIIAVEVRYATLNSQHRSWGPAHSTEHTRSQLGSGTPHWTRRIAVGVRYATLHSQDRNWSPARHTELTGSQLRSDMPHWTHRIATGQEDGRRGGGEEGGEGGGGEETDIKSNNPHLTGGEKQELMGTVPAVGRAPRVGTILVSYQWGNLGTIDYILSSRKEMQMASQQQVEALCNGSWWVDDPWMYSLIALNATQEMYARIREMMILAEPLPAQQLTSSLRRACKPKYVPGGRQSPSMCLQQGWAYPHM